MREFFREWGDTIIAVVVILFFLLLSYLGGILINVTK